MAEFSRPTTSIHTTEIPTTESVHTNGLVIFVEARFDDHSALLSRLNLPPSASNTDIVGRAYSQWGKNCVRHLIGDFAFVILDSEKRSIFCARDHIGVQPFFYALDTEKLRFASDIESLVSADPALEVIDSAFAANVLVANDFTSDRRTFLRNIHKLPPGHTLTINAKSEVIERFWKPRDIQQVTLGSDAEYIEAARSIFETAVKDRLRNAAKPAVHLSGGLDSTAVAAIVAKSQRQKNADQPIGYAWHLQNPDQPEDDETRWTEAARQSLNLAAFAPSVSKDAVVALLRADWCRGPDAAKLLHEDAIQTHAQSQSVDLILSGWGGDESISFNGRGYRAELFGSLRWKELAAISAGTGPAALARGIKNGFMEMQSSSKPSKLQLRIKNSYLNSDFADLTQLIEGPRLSMRSPHDVMAGLIETGKLTDRLEDWSISGQKMGIRYAYPMLDRRVMEFALSLPGHLFLRPGSRRWIMREMLGPEVPDIIRHNNTKMEPARVKALSAIMHLAFADCADLLESIDPAGERAQYVDIKRLIGDLRGGENAVRTNFSHKRRALQFLLF